ncbi:hypothetical protein HDV05_003037 [Chytridiales sp. JEL 0842]|nr:hypothetical protein HDV05_003037 [Chytridiales sp. JEL 0842]
MAAAVCTHPLDTLKIRLQTATTKASLVRTVVSMIKSEGILTFYSGLSASLLRQATYSTARFAVYDGLKAYMVKQEKGPLPFYKQLLIGVVGGAAGGLIGSPADLVNVRMQDDGRLPVEQRRGYRNAFHGGYRIIKDEGPLALFRGLGPNVQRAMLMTASQVGSYDIIKQKMLESGYLKDNAFTHFLASTSAGLIATTVTSPVDVLKTRIMTAQAGTYKGTADAFVKVVGSEGFGALFKGWLPAFTRLGPHTVLTFIVYEQLRVVYAKYLAL